MSKQSLLLVDGDPRSLRVLEVSLKKAGFNVTTATNGRDALDKVELAPPDLVIAETQLEELDGFTFCQKLKGNPAWADIPFVFLTAQTDIATKIRGLELGVDDYLTKPIYIKEIVARARILLQKRQRTRIEERRDGRTRFAGHLSDMPIVDLIQTVEISRKSGLIQFIGEDNKAAAIYFRDGKVIDAEAGPLQAEDAVYRLLTWNEGEFEVAFRTVRRRDTITMSAQALLMEGMRRLDEWGRLCEQLPPLETRFEVDARELASRLGDILDEHNAILRLFDGRRSVLEVIDACDYGDLESLEVIARLYFEGVLVEAGPIKPTMSGEWMVPTAAIEAASGALLAPTTGLVSEGDDGDDDGEPAGGAQPIPSGSRTISGEWMLEGEAERGAEAPAVPAAATAAKSEGAGSGRRPSTAPPTLPRTLTPAARPATTVVIPALPTVGARKAGGSSSEPPPAEAPGRRPSLIQKAIDDSDAIEMLELEESLRGERAGTSDSDELMVGVENAGAETRRPESGETVPPAPTSEHWLDAAAPSQSGALAIPVGPGSSGARSSPDATAAAKSGSTPTPAEVGGRGSGALAVAATGASGAPGASPPAGVEGGSASGTQPSSAAVGVGVSGASSSPVASSAGTPAAPSSAAAVGVGVSGASSSGTLASGAAGASSSSVALKPGASATSSAAAGVDAGTSGASSSSSVTRTSGPSPSSVAVGASSSSAAAGGTSGASPSTVTKSTSGASGTASISASAAGAASSSKAAISGAADAPAGTTAASADKASGAVTSVQSKDGKAGGMDAGAKTTLTFEANASSADGTAAAGKAAAGTSAGATDAAGSVGGKGTDAKVQGATDAQLRGARGVDRSRGSATLVTDPPPAVATATGSQPVPIERSQPVRIERGEEAARPAAAAPEPLPPNRRGSRWPAVVIGAAVIVGVGYAAIRIGRSRPKQTAVAGLISDGGVGASAMAKDAGGATTPAADAGVALGPDASAGPTDAAMPPTDAATPRDAAAPSDAARPPPSEAATAAQEEYRRKLDGARKLIERDPQAALDIIDGLLDDQRSARALIARADALYRLKRTDAAASAIGAALSMAPRNPAAWELKGRILWDAGRKEDARPAYVRFLELQPTGATAETVRRRLSGT